jgi:peptide/nickel transport system substrate-binding protein
VNKILDAAPKGGVTDEQWAQLNQAVMASATYLPVYYGKVLFYRNPRMTNVTCDNALAFGMYDFVNVGVNG